MKKRLPENCRVRTGPLASDPEAGNNGAFLILVPKHLPTKIKGQAYLCLISNGMGWEHVSVSIYNTKGKNGMNIMPSWDDMCYIKDTFWEKSECVVQYHPPEEMYVDNHKYCLHLWRPTDGDVMPLPHPALVGLKGFTLGTLGKKVFLKKKEGVVASTEPAADGPPNPPINETLTE